ncbi:hypothetical protein SKAU_G00252630 [Synaphobranchus kaupii]|uniref:Uncharacterized protein n=1 Tax=Synaphobranchus kaupii TaxID=118154 RepID=A0A9Q1F361_SYNKA|nr:hypothetical protein SKAU_G00252630 [Synaphobranchus kaupii]
MAVRAVPVFDSGARCGRNEARRPNQLQTIRQVSTEITQQGSLIGSLSRISERE